MWHKYLLQFTAGMLGGILLSYFKSKLSRGKGSKKNEYCFINFDGISCQMCYNERRANICGNKTCSFGLLRSTVRLLDEAQDSIYFCNPIILDPDVVYALVKAHKRNVSVLILVDARLTAPPEMINFLKAGIHVKQRGNSNVMMHNKFIVVDKKLLIRGSLNYTSSLKGNCENIQFLRDQERILRYSKHFLELWNDESSIHKNGPGSSSIALFS